MTGPAPRVAIIHPWLPQYRISFFEQLYSALQHSGILLDIFYGQTPPEWAARADSGSSPIAVELRTHFLSVGGRFLNYKSLRPLSAHRPYDLIIIEQAVRNLESYRILFDRMLSKKVAFWGHGRTYTQANSALEERIKMAVTKRGHWFYGYTQAGVDHFSRLGFPLEKTTVVQNSIDTNQLRQDLALVCKGRQDVSRRTHPKNGTHAIYIGGIDESKRIEFLLQTAAKVHALRPDFSLTLVGNGSQADMLSAMAVEHDWLNYRGELFGVQKAAELLKADFMLVPGRVGLVAVDSLTAGVPIVTTDWPLHAPEFEYLQNGYTTVIADNSLHSYIRTIVDLIDDKLLLRTLQDNCLVESEQYTSEAMVDRFAGGVRAALATPTRGRMYGRPTS